jgi:hypothetical protein
MVFKNSKYNLISRLAGFLISALCLQLIAQQTCGLTSTTIADDAADRKGVISNIGDLQKDVERVTNIKPKAFTTEASSQYDILIGTAGRKLLQKIIIKNRKTSYE